MGFPTRLIVGGAVAGLALTYYVRSRRARTGDGYLQIIRQLPGDAARLIDETRERATSAFDVGATAAREREAEFSRQLQAAGAQPDP